MPSSEQKSSSDRSKKTILSVVYNLKGGVAKTTSTLEMGYLMSKKGLKVLLVDADMQANLTTKFIYSTCIQAAREEQSANEGEAETPSSEERVEDQVEKAYDEMWKEINIEEVPSGNELRAFHHILQQFTQTRIQFSRAQLDSIKPFEAKMSDPNQQLHLIAGHLSTSEYDEKVSRGFRDQERMTIPGLVTNIIREFAEKNDYDLVIFDLGPYLSPVAKAIILGVDYIISPFKCERDCVTAAEIVPRKLRDFHKKFEGDSTTQLNEQCVLTVKDWYRHRYRPRESAANLAAEVSSELRCFPVFIGAFPVSVSFKRGKPTRDYARFMADIFDCYNASYEGYNRVFASNFRAYHGIKSDLPKPDFKRLRKLWVENTHRVGMQATSNEDGSIPCVSWYRDFLELNKNSPNLSKSRIDMTSQLKKANRVVGQYEDIIDALLNGMRPADQHYLRKKMGQVTDESDSESMEEGEVRLEDSPSKRQRVGDRARLFNHPRRSRTRIYRGGGYAWQDVGGEGNCFYHALAAQLTGIGHVVMAEKPEGTEAHTFLRGRITDDFQDGEWADHDQLVAAMERLNIIIGVFDTRHQQQPMRYHYLTDEGTEEYAIDRAALPERPVVELAYTGNHYLSVIERPDSPEVAASLNAVSV